MGFSSGLPLLLIGSTLRAYLTESDLDLKTIGVFSLVQLPYTWKFLWSPLMDRFTPFKIGRRKSWLIITQLLLMGSLFLFSFLNPRSQLWPLSVLCLLISFFSASQDIVADAYRREILTDEELGLGSSVFVLGYRMALLVAGAGGLFLADVVAWSQVYKIMAALVSVGLITTLIAPEPKIEVPAPRNFREAVVGPFRDFFTRHGAFLVLAFVLFYKIGESMASDMYNTFLIKIGFTKTEIATVSKVFGIWAMIVGSIVGGAILVRVKLIRALWIFGVLQAVGLLLFAWLATVGVDLKLLSVAIGVENFTSGMATSAYVAFISTQANKRFSATQLALLSSLMGVPRAIFGASTGYLASSFGWAWFFVICSVAAIPGLLLLIPLRRLLK